MFKELKEYGVKFKDLKGVSGSLNDAGIAGAQIKVVGVKGADMLAAFLNAIESVPDKSVGEIPKDASDFYDALPDSVFDDAPVETEAVTKKTAAPSKAKAKAKADKKVKDTKKGKGKADKKAKEAVAKGSKVESDCPGFLTSCNDEEENCQDCAKQFVKEYTACKDACQAKAKAEAKASKRTTTPGKKTRYGHSLNTMTGQIDDLLWAGKTKEAIATAVAKRFDRTPAKAASCLRGHLKRMIRLAVITLEEREDGVLKAENEYAEGFTKENTEKA